MKKSERETTTVRVHPRLWQTTKIQAVREKRDASDIIEDALTLYLTNLGQQAG
ncbi:MAG: hypothetical protein HC866_19640 [Leptolyngbyaceae cyanobacterium RU_5_1]|nr:hypothetical protein [Leptolyngbyaceae cyanobacterium RU_5_1]